MSTPALESLDGVSLMFRAFSDPIRLRMLHLLQGGERCVGDLVEALRIPQPTASRHLAALRRAGLVRRRQTGPWRYYSLATASSAFHRRLLSCVASCFDEVPEFRADRQRLGDVEESGSCC